MSGQIAGIAKAGSRTKDLTKRLNAGEVAVIDHEDLDPVAVDALIGSRVAAVINCSPSFSGKYPNVGPRDLVAAGVLLVDLEAPGIMLSVSDNSGVVLSWDTNGAATVAQFGQTIGTGRVRDLDTLDNELTESRRNVADQLERFAENTLEYMLQERHLATDAPDLPLTRVVFKNRHVLIVVRGVDFKEDLSALKTSGYLREMKPIVIGVDGGADELLEQGITPDLIIGDFDSVSEHTLRCGAELIVHAYAGGRAPGAERLTDLGLNFLLFESAGTSEDIAMLLAYELGAELLVAVGTHSSMEDFLDKGRKGMASTFLVRLKVGRMLVDAKGVNRLYRPVVRTRDAWLFASVMLVSLVAVVSISEPVRLWGKSVWVWLKSVFG